ncbi:MAG: TolC family protein [Anaerotignum sp.]|nr:TolC family protein [Anaerotignum sp.]
MKAFLYKAKGVLALTLAMSMFCPQVYAAALSAAEQGVQEPPVVELTEEEILAQQIPVLTVEEAIDLAIKHSPDLQDIEDSLDMLKENDEDIYDRYGSVNVNVTDHTRWIADEFHALYSAVFNIENGLKQAKLGRELQEMVLETTVKTYFTTIISIEDSLELARESAAMQQKTYEQGYTKYRLGMLSKYNLDQLQVAAQKAKDSVATTESMLEQMYITFNDLIGKQADDRFDFVYDVTFEPYEMDMPMDMYIHDKMNDDVMIKMQELTVEAAKFARNVRSYSDAQGTYDNAKLTYDQQKRALRVAKDEKETLIRNTYLQIKSLETEYSSAQADLKKAEADLRATQLSYQTGAVTKMAVQGAEMGVAAAQNALKGIIYEHDMLIYKFENPSMLFSNTGSAQ